MDFELTQKNPGVLAQDAAIPFEAGQVLDGKYEILSLLGRGGMGAVYRVYHTLLNVELALKTLDTQRIGDASSSRRFQTEAKAAFSLKHPNLVKVHDYGLLEDVYPFLVMDLVQGKTLQALIEERGKLNLDEIESIFAQLCFGLSYAHGQQVVHRDIKPANIMLVDGLALSAEGSVKILDFGIAKIVNADRGEMQTLTQTGEVFGSPLYMSPEQCSGATIDQRSDIYSLGCVLFEALTGTPPMVGSNALRTMMLHVNDTAPTLKEATLGSHYPEELEVIVGKMLAKSPGDRYADLGVVAHELSRVCGGSRRESSNESTLEDSNKKPVAAAEKKKPLTVKLSPMKLAAAIVATICVSSLFTLCYDRFFKADSTNNAAKETSKDHMFSGVHQDLVGMIGESSANIKEKFELLESIYGTPVGSGMQRIVFPDASIGKLHYGVKEFCEAKGPVVVPIDSRLELEVKFGAGEVLQNAFVFDKIAPDLLTGLMFTGIGRNSVLKVLGDAEFSKEQEDGAKHLLIAAANWKRLDLLRLTDVKLTPGLFAALDNMQPRHLHLNRVRFDPHSLENREIFQRIKFLTLENVDTAPILAEVAHSSSIRLINTGSRVSAKSIENLNNSVSLKTIVFSIHDLPADVVTAASKLKHVSNLFFLKNELSKTQIKELSKDWEQVPSKQRNTVMFRRRV